MAPLTPPVCDFDWKAPHFSLPGTDGRTYSLTDVAGEKSTLVMFICNHCPFVLAVMDKIVRDAHDMKEHGIGVVAICSNDHVAYPQDSFDNMRLMSERHAFPFPYLQDAEQEVARSYDAVCTPDFFGFNKDFGLQYRGRLDAARMNETPAELRRDLFEAMKQIAETGRGPEDQIPSIGCSIKWKS